MTKLSILRERDAKLYPERRKVAAPPKLSTLRNREAKLTTALDKNTSPEAQRPILVKITELRQKINAYETAERLAAQVAEKQRIKDDPTVDSPLGYGEQKIELTAP